MLKGKRSEFIRFGQGTNYMGWINRLRNESEMATLTALLI